MLIKHFRDEHGLAMTICYTVRDKSGNPASPQSMADCVISYGVSTPTRRHSTDGSYDVPTKITGVEIASSRLAKTPLSFRKTDSGSVLKQILTHILSQKEFSNSTKRIARSSMKDTVR